jgi:hypothetical protein
MGGMVRRVTIAMGILMLVSGAAQAQKADGLALTPPMGWNSWNHFGCDIDEQLIRETAEALVTTGLRDAGYVYLNLDDCWHGERDADGFIHADRQRFPSGIKALADYVHARGLKLGIYSDAGRKTCGGRPGLRPHAGPGHWNDPDMLEVGNLPTLGEDRAHFAMWAMLAAPLIIGTDVRDLDPAVLAVLKNEGVIAVNQDARGIQGFPFLKTGELEIWVKVLEGGDFALAFLNRGGTPLTERFDFAATELGDDLVQWRPDFAAETYRIVDLWTGASSGTSSQPMELEIAAHDARIFRLTR